MVSVIWQGWLGSLRLTYMAEHTVWQRHVRVPWANAACLFTQLDLKRIGRSQEMFSLHWSGSPHIVVRSEAEACHEHGSAPLRQHSISSMYFVNKRFGFPARRTRTSNPPIRRSLGQICSKQHENKSCIERISCGTWLQIVCFIALRLSVKFTTQWNLSHICVKQQSQKNFILSPTGS